MEARLEYRIRDGQQEEIKNDVADALKQELNVGFGAIPRIWFDLPPKMERLTLQKGRQGDRNIRDADEAPAHFDRISPVKVSAEVGIKYEQNRDLEPVVRSVEEPCHKCKDAASLDICEVGIVVLMSQHTAGCAIMDVDVDHNDASDQYSDRCNDKYGGHAEASISPSCQYNTS